MDPSSDSEDRYKIDTELVEELVAEQFPRWAQLPITSVEQGGWDNLTFHLGTDKSIRIPSAARYVAQVEKEHRWLPHLSKTLPLPIPSPAGLGSPSALYKHQWSIYHWIKGAQACYELISDLSVFASDLAQFLLALHQVDADEGPTPGAHNFFRGGSLRTYDKETREALSKLRSIIDTDSVVATWEAALESEWLESPVWVHGDIAPGNLLVSEGALCAVIDFGSCAVGDPACDLTIAWTFFSGESRKTFRESMSLDASTWARARGWALWKAAIAVNPSHEGECANEIRVLKEVR